MTQAKADSQAAISAAVIVKDGKVLLIRRKVAEGSLNWQFPAGQVEPGETPEQAAIREAQEETGVTATAVKALGDRVHPVTGRTMYYVACELLAGNAHVADAEEIAEVTWAARSDVQTFIPHGVFAPVQAYLDDLMLS